MDELARYIRIKALADTLDKLSPEQRDEFLRLYGSRSDIQPQKNYDSQQLDRIEQAATRPKFFNGVAQNLVGNAAYDVARRIVSALLKTIH